MHVKSKRCLQDGCDVIPAFNPTDQNKGIYCDKHKKMGMIDVKNKKCPQA